MNIHGDGDSIVAARISHSLRGSIDEAAARASTTRSEYIRTALETDHYRRAGVPTGATDMKAESIERQIIADRAERAARTGEDTPECVACGRATLSPDGFYHQRCRDWIARGESTARDRGRLDRFAYASLRHVAGPDAGHLPRGMRAGPSGFFIRCHHCEMEFESKGLRCCSDDCERSLQRAEDAGGYRSDPPGTGTRQPPSAISETLINHGSENLKYGPFSVATYPRGGGFQAPAHMLDTEVFSGRSKAVISADGVAARVWKRHG